MTSKTVWRAAVLLALAFGITWSAAAQERLRAPTPNTTAPRLLPVAETKLVMEGIAQANFQGLERNLKQKPAEAETWTFLRGQALLVAESGNLLMIRPPRNDGQNTWMQRATDMREAAATLAKHAGNRDYERCQTALTDLANTCNRCHQTFRVQVPIGAPADKLAPQLEKIGPPKGQIKGNRDTE
jgi:Cytochrome C'